MAITRTPMTDDDGSGTTGTIINSAWKVELYDQIDAAIVGITPPAPYTSGSWIPSLQGTTAGTVQSYATRSGLWQRSGPLVSVVGVVAVSVKGGTLIGNAVIRDLPFPVGTSECSGGMMFPFFGNLGISVFSLIGFPRANTTQIEIAGMTASGITNTFFPVSIITDSSSFYFAGSYFTSAP